MPTPYTPPDFTCHEAYLAYLKAVKNGQVKIYSTSPDEAGTLPEIEPPNQFAGAAEYPPEFTCHEAYLAYLKAVKNGQVKIYSTSPDEAGNDLVKSAPPRQFAGTAECRPHFTPAGVWETCKGFHGLAVLKAIP